jgi:hypothetical protein
VTSCIFFWTGARPVSLAKVEERLASLEGRVRLLNATSSDAKAREQLWQKKLNLPFEPVEAEFPRAKGVDCDSAREVMDKRMFAKEAELQPARGRVFEEMKLDTVVRDAGRGTRLTLWCSRGRTLWRWSMSMCRLS